MDLLLVCVSIQGLGCLPQGENFWLTWPSRERPGLVLTLPTSLLSMINTLSRTVPAVLVLLREKRAVSSILVRTIRVLFCAVLLPRALRSKTALALLSAPFYPVTVPLRAR